MSKFKKGDRVIVKKCYDNALVVGKTGTVIGVDGNTGIYAVEFDDYVGGHNAKPAYEGRDGHCWFLTNKELKPASKFEAGQVYRAMADGSISIIKITSSTGYYVTYETIRSKRNEVGSFLSTSLFAKRLEPLVGPQIGEAIKEYDADRYEKKVDKPEHIEVKRKAKVGDTVKILKNCGGMVTPGKIGRITGVCSDFETVEIEGHGGFTVQFSDGDYVVIASGKHVYSDYEIASAKAFVLNTIRDLAEKGTGTYVFFGTNKDGNCTALVTGKNSKAKVYGNYAELYQLDTGESKCSPNDVPNTWIGKAVALCRALGRPIPDYVR